MHPGEIVKLREIANVQTMAKPTVACNCNVIKDGSGYIDHPQKTLKAAAAVFRKMSCQSTRVGQLHAARRSWHVTKHTET